MKEIYDKVYAEIPHYDLKMQHKINMVEKQLPQDYNTQIIDIGCGKGHYARSLQANGYTNYTAIEFSTACCEQYLSDIPHINRDFLEYGPTIESDSFDVVLCMDVLEHISHENINTFVGHIARIGSKAILGVANHSDIFLGEELHIIQEGVQWWTSLLCKHFTNVDCIEQSSFDKNGPRFFMFVCDK